MCGTKLTYAILFVVVSVAMVSLNGCAPTYSEILVLKPHKGQDVITMRELMLRDSSMAKDATPEMDQIVVTLMDSTMVCMVLWELDAIFWLNIYLFNGSSQQVSVDPEQFVLVDRWSTFFRRLEPHEAANIYISRLTAIPPYLPKMKYDAYSYSYSYLDPLGNVQTNTRTTIRSREDPYVKLGHSLIGLAISLHNQKVTVLANAIYNVGLTKYLLVPSQSGGTFGVYYLKLGSFSSPVRLRLLTTGQEFTFGTRK